MGWTASRRSRECNHREVAPKKLPSELSPMERSSSTSKSSEFDGRIGSSGGTQRWSQIATGLLRNPCFPAEFAHPRYGGGESHSLRHRFSVTKKSFKIRRFSNRRFLAVEHRGELILAFLGGICEPNKSPVGALRRRLWISASAIDGGQRVHHSKGARRRDVGHAARFAGFPPF
jgi:hypothetical protein